MKARCVICGARARSGATCGGVCTRARKNGVSRETQFYLDMEAQEWTWRDSSVRQRGSWSSLAFSGVPRNQSLSPGAFLS
jgi:hypothetical protein